MKTIIICASTHHGNTRKLVDAIVAKHPDIEVVDSTKETSRDLSGYDLIGFASGIYGANFHPSIVKFAKENLPENKKIFYISTAAMDRDFSKSMAGAVGGKNTRIVGYYHCQGYNTFGPFKLIGGTAKGKPDAQDIQNAVDFYDRISKI